MAEAIDFKVDEPVDFQLDFQPDGPPPAVPQKRIEDQKTMLQLATEGGIAEQQALASGALERMAWTAVHPIKAAEQLVEGAATLIAGKPLVIKPGFKPSEILERPIAQIKQIPKQESVPAQIGAGAVNAITGFVNGFLSPEGVAALGIGGLPKAMQKLVLTAFGTQMVLNAPEKAIAAGEAVKAGNWQEAAQHVTAGLGEAGLGSVLLKAGTSPAVSPQLEALAPQTAAATKEALAKPEPKGESNAQAIRSDTGQVSPAGVVPERVQDQSGKNLQLTSSEQPESVSARVEQAEGQAPQAPGEKPVEFLSLENRNQDLRLLGLSDSDISDLDLGKLSVSDVVSRKLRPFDVEYGGGPDHAVALEQARIEAIGQIESVLKKYESLSRISDKEAVRVPKEPSTGSKQMVQTVQGTTQRQGQAQNVTPPGAQLGIVPPSVAQLSQATGKATDWIARHFTKEKGAPEEVYQEWLKRTGTVNEQATAALHAVDDLTGALRKHVGVRVGPLGKKVDPALVKQINNSLRGEQSINDLPEALREPVQKMRDHVDSLSEQMVREGLVDERLQAVIGENLGVYLNRSYRVFEDPKWTYDKIPIDVKNRARQFLRDEMNLNEQQAESYMRDLFEDWKAGGVGKLFSPRKLGSKDLSLLRKRKDIAPEIRALMGEYTDPFVNYQRSIAKMSRFVADQKFLNAVKEMGMGKWFFEEGQNPPGFNTQIAAEGSSTMAPLNGLRTTEHLAKVFNEWNAVSPELNPAFKIYMALNAASKMSKTVYSPMTHSRNLFSQSFFWLLNGHYDIRGLDRAIDTVLTEIGAMKDPVWRQYQQKLARLNLLNESAFSGEVRDSIKDFSKRMADQTVEPLSYSLGRALKSIVIDAPEKAYRISDEFGKIVGFEAEKARVLRDNPGMEMEAAERLAAERVRNTYPTYSNIPKAVQATRRVPLVGPFMSFAYESIRTTGHALRYAAEDFANGHIRSGVERSTGALLALGALTFGLQALSRYLVGLTRRDDQDLRRQLPPWEKNSAMLYTDREKKGVSYINLSYNNPYSYMIDPIIAAANGEQGTLNKRLLNATAEFLRPFTTEQMLASALIDLDRNQTADGRRIFNPQAPAGDQWEDSLQHIWEAMEPGGITRLRKRIIPAAQGRPDARATLTQEAVAELTGYREQRHDFLKHLSFSGRKFTENMNDATRLFSEGLGSLKPSPDILGQYKTMDEARFRLWREMHQDIQAAQRQGVEQSEIRKALTDAGVGKEDTGWLMRGKYKPYEVPKETASRAKRAGKTIPRDQIMEIYRQRRGQVLE